MYVQSRNHARTHQNSIEAAMHAVAAVFCCALPQVLAEVAQMRSGWLQAKAIIKQQRRTIKQQELQLQLALNGALPGVAAGNAPLLLQQKLQQEDGFAAGMVGVSADGARSAGGSFPITSFVLQQQQLQQQQQQQQRSGRSAGGAASFLPGSLAWAAVQSMSFGGADDAKAAMKGGHFSSSDVGQGLGAFGLQQGQGQEQFAAASATCGPGASAAAQQAAIDQQLGGSAAAKNVAVNSFGQAQQRHKFGDAAAAVAHGSNTAAVGAAEFLGCTDEILRSLRGQ
jgi:hypothetical protein